ncbi:MAG: 5-bromo-4-chloroindolyl phosphate hydrolysis family protein [Clostridia bacterium]|nr:5-bromo-4-chloroindolyl phosphate hydrolysis family protein [Clostridia bacterium]
MSKKHIKSAMPLYCAAAIWLVMGLVLPIYKLWAILVTLVLSVAAAILLKKVFPGRDIEIQKKADSGNAEVNRQIEEGRATLRRLHEANDAIDDAAISTCIERMEKAGAGIFDTLEKDVSKANQVRRFMNYYLPTADKLLTQYRQLSGVAGGENVNSAIKSIENSMEMIAVAFEKQLDALFKDSALDIETDIDVLETMIKADGHADQGTPLGGV